jgi:galactose mutarotase-like enzyme
MKGYLRSSDGSTFALVSSKGGTVMDFTYKEADIIYPQRPVGAKMRGGIPICFPFFGPAPERFSREIPQHGWLRDEELKVVKMSSSSAVFCGNNHAKSFQWNLNYQVTIEVEPGTLILDLQIQRMQDSIAEDCPVNPAFHPYFSNLGKREVRIGNNLYSEFPVNTLTVPSAKNILINNGTDQIKMSLREGFKESSPVSLWSDSEDYFCVEPVLTAQTDFNGEKGIYLKKKEIINLKMVLTVATPEYEENKTDVRDSRRHPVLAGRF